MHKHKRLALSTGVAAGLLLGGLVLLWARGLRAVNEGHRLL